MTPPNTATIPPCGERWTTCATSAKARGCGRLMIGLRITRTHCKTHSHLVVEQRAYIGAYPEPVWTLYAVDGERVQ